MRYLISIKTLAALPAILFVVFAGNSPAEAQTETVLHNFSGTDGTAPVLSVIFDSAGNLYGVTSQGGSSNNGTVFELSPKGNGTWTDKTLISFNGSAGGSTPAGGVALDSSGSLYGTTKLGGTNGLGIAYELVKSSSGTWSEKILHNFGAAKDGIVPTSSVVLDTAGNVYGTTQGGGAYGNGTITAGGTAFKLSKNSSGTWTETVIHSFGNGTDGAIPRSNLVLDSSGNLYGTASKGGTFAGGTVFELMPQPAGGWKEKTLHNFNPAYNQDNFQTDGYTPHAGVTFDHSGNLFGTTSIGGYYFGGIAFELSPGSGGTWNETVLYAFDWLQYDSFPNAGVIVDSAGNVYGVTIGKPNFIDFHGTVFKLTPQSGPFWLEKQVYTFDGTHGAGGAVGSLTMDSSGNLYGGTPNGGTQKRGVVFKVTP